MASLFLSPQSSILAPFWHNWPFLWKLFLYLPCISHQPLRRLFSAWMSLPLQPEANILASTTNAQRGKALSALLPRGGRCLLPNGNSKPNFIEKHSYTRWACSIFLLIALIFRYVLELILEPINNDIFLQGNDCKFCEDSLINQL